MGVTASQSTPDCPPGCVGSKLGCVGDDVRGGIRGCGRTAGIAIFQLPSLANVAWYAGTYGSVRVNPFRKGAIFVSRGEEVDLAVRLVAHDGDPFEAGVPELYEAFRVEIG